MQSSSGGKSGACATYSLPLPSPPAQTQCGDVRFGSKADMCSAKRHVRFVPIADMIAPHGLHNHADHSARRTCRAQERSDLSQLVVCRPPQLVARPRPLYEHWRGPRSVGARYSLQKEKWSVLNSHRCLFSLIAGSIWGTSPNRAERRGTPWRK